ncbi:unnamed protein product [Oppiella nova]|uniref:C2H2-type domain-containing protein n=1 Tax=Oppiella nova TaxID=334625 RepID=A0A7R9LC70_9ACAR|nr:unnamed protein product [Oppiella nova]CAG2162110.1 unnamed protein product [Oppiella nova]
MGINNNKNQRKNLLQWIRTKVRGPFFVTNFTEDWKDGILLCALIEGIVPGSCPRFDLLSADNEIDNINLGLALIKRHLNIDSTIESHEIHDCKEEAKFVYFLSRVKFESMKLLMKSLLKRSIIQKRDSSGASHMMFESLFSDEKVCFAKGMGLILGVRTRKARFNIFCKPTPKLNLMIEIMGPNNTMCSEKIAVFSQKRKFSSDVITKSLIEDFLNRKKSSEDILKIPFFYEVFSNKIVVTYIPLMKGIHKLSIIWQGQHILSSPYTVKVEDCYIDPVKPSDQMNGSMSPTVFVPGLQYPVNALTRKESISFDECATVVRRKVLKQTVVINGTQKIFKESQSDSGVCSHILNTDAIHQNLLRRKSTSYPNLRLTDNKSVDTMVDNEGDNSCPSGQYIDDEIPDYSKLFGHYFDDLNANKDQSLAQDLGIYPEKCEVFGAGAYYGQVGVKNHFMVSTKDGGKSYLAVGVQSVDSDDVIEVSFTSIGQNRYEVQYEVSRPGYYVIFANIGFSSSTCDPSGEHLESGSTKCEYNNNRIWALSLFYSGAVIAVIGSLATCQSSGYLLIVYMILYVGWIGVIVGLTVQRMSSNSLAMNEAFNTITEEVIRDKWDLYAQILHLWSHFISKFIPILDRYRVPVPMDCPFHPQRDYLWWPDIEDEYEYDDEISFQWTCPFCGSNFLCAERLAIHWDEIHRNEFTRSEDSICLADFCDIMRCDVIIANKRKRRNRLRSLALSKNKTEFNIQTNCDPKHMKFLENKCETIVRQCTQGLITSISSKDYRDIEYELIESVCSYLTCDRYLDDYLHEH